MPHDSCRARLPLAPTHEGRRAVGFPVVPGSSEYAPTPITSDPLHFPTPGDTIALWALLARHRQEHIRSPRCLILRADKGLGNLPSRTSSHPS